MAIFTLARLSGQKEAFGLSALKRKVALAVTKDGLQAPTPAQDHKLTKATQQFGQQQAPGGRMSRILARLFAGIMPETVELL